MKTAAKILIGVAHPLERRTINLMPTRARRKAQREVLASLIEPPFGGWRKDYLLACPD
jgi:hypothetical protein